MKANCGNCDYFRRKQEGFPEGDCRAKSPTAFVIPSGPNRISVVGGWPKTEEKAWCGEHWANEIVETSEAP